METMHRRCAGLDVHQKEIVACRRIVSGRKVRSELERFSTTAPGLVALSNWLTEARVWKPVWHVLCGDFKLILANAAHIRNVPGRKSDANDATWIADLLERDEFSWDRTSRSSSLFRAYPVVAQSH